jgi:hypothetical protein
VLPIEQRGPSETVHDDTEGEDIVNELDSELAEAV